MSGERPPWVWDELPDDAVRERWRALVAWVQWLEDAYQPWVVLPPCWPEHEGLRHELALFWYWHAWLTTTATDPVAGVRWHADLRNAAAAWRELATCGHRPTSAEHAQIVAAQRACRDQFVEDALARRATSRRGES
jgi:hypothetical protein